MWGNKKILPKFWKTFIILSVVAHIAKNDEQIKRKSIKINTADFGCHVNTMNFIVNVIFFLRSMHCFSSKLSQGDTVDLKNARLNPKFINKWLDEYFEVSGNRVPPRLFVEWIKLASENNCSIRPSDYKSIFEDLKPFKMPGMSKEYIKIASNIIEAYDKEVLLLYKDNLGEISKKLPLHIGNSLDLAGNVLSPDIDFNLIIQYSDESMVIPSDDHSLEPYTSIDSVFERNLQFRDAFSSYRGNYSLLSAPVSLNAIPAKFPVMAVSRIRGFYDIIMPTRRTGLVTLTAEQRAVAANYSNWDYKIGKALFRGTAAGINFKEAMKKDLDLLSNPRFLLYEMALQQQEGTLNCSVQLDFAITKYWQFNGDLEYLGRIKAAYPEVPSSGLIEQYKSKYVVVVDGNSWPEKVAAFMFSGSLVFLATIHEDWVIRQLVEGENYIKIKPDLSDLIEKLEWARENDEEARRIAANGRLLATKKFDTNHLQIYNALLVMEYQNLFA